MFGIILHGPPGVGKDTATQALHELDSRYVRFPRLKAGLGDVGAGDAAAFRMTTRAELDRLEAGGDIIWRNEREGDLYAIDRPELLRRLATQTPVLHVGQVDAVAALRRAVPQAHWLTAFLWCPRDVAAARNAGRIASDECERVRDWDAAALLMNADLVINTADITPHAAARELQWACRKLH